MYIQFKELSKGKDYITEKALRKWDELQELIDADLATKEIIESYFIKLNIPNGKIDFKLFEKFINMLDMVLVDESGTMLGFDDIDDAIDLGDLDVDEDEDE